MAASLGDYLKSINETKKDILINDKDAEDSYPQYVVTKTLSYHVDTILFANEVNKAKSLNNLQHYHCLLYSIRQGKRFARWSKPDEDDKIIEAIMKVNQCSRERALEQVKLLNDDGKQYFLKRTEQGD